MAIRTMAPYTIGERFSRDYVFDEKRIVEFATMAGDLNPLHHDRAFAEASPFKGLIASGTHSCSVMMGMLGSYLSERFLVVGLGLSFQLKKPVRAGEKAKIDWEIVGIRRKESLNGDIVTFEGALRNEQGEAAVIAKCDNLIYSVK